MDTGTRATGQDLQGAGSGANDGASGRDLQGSSPQTGSDSSNLNSLQPQGSFTVQDLSNNILPKPEADGGGLMWPVIIAAVIIVILVLIFVIKKYMLKAIDMELAVEPPLESEPPVVAGEAIKKTTVENLAPKEKMIELEEAPKPVAMPSKAKHKKRSSSGRKKR